LVGKHGQSSQFGCANLTDASIEAVAVGCFSIASVRWFRLAADVGLADVQDNLNACYSNGVGVAQDHAEAVGWFRLTADQGAANAQYSLGGCYFDGTGVERDVEQAAQWFKRAALKGHDGAKKRFRAALEVIKRTRSD
jgi:TPR repeat protein